MNRDYIKMTDELLAKYLLQEASPEEAETVDLWIRQSENNKKYFEHFQLIWETSKHLAAKSTVNEQEAWERFKMRVDNQHDEMPKTVRLNPFTYIRAAAILLLIIGGGLFFYLFSDHTDMQLAMANGNVITDTLPDGSVVTLNKHATLKYPESFKGKERRVILEGEAFFHVMPDKQHPFIIEANESVVTVVGTSFNVNTSAQKTEVIVEAGIVEVAKDVHKVTLNPHEKATVTTDKDEPLKQENKDALYNYYRTQEFICNGTPLWRLVDVLNQAYNTDIIIADGRLRNLPLTTTFRNEPLDNILQVISETFNITVDKKNGQIILK